MKIRRAYGNRDGRNTRHGRGDHPTARAGRRPRRRRLQPKAVTAEGVCACALRPKGARCRCTRGTSASPRTASGSSTRSWAPRPHRLPGQQRRHHRRQDRAQDDDRGLARGAPGQPVRRLLHDQGRARAHDRPRLRAHRQHLVGHRRDRQHRAGELRGLEVRPVRFSKSLASRSPARASPSTASPPASSTPTWSPRYPRTCSKAIVESIPVGDWARPRRSPGPCPSSLDEDVGLHHRLRPRHQRRPRDLGKERLHRSFLDGARGCSL